MRSSRTDTAESVGEQRVIYLDTSAAMKLVRPEAHSGDLSRWFSERQAIPVLSSVLIEVELVRAARRIAPERAGRVADVLSGIGVVTLSPSVIARRRATLIPICVHLTPSTWQRPSTSRALRTRSWRHSSRTTSVYSRRRAVSGSRSLLPA